MAEDRNIATDARGNAPIVWHPLFPACVAVWFGALFGLGALAVRPALLEAAVLSAGIEHFIPAAAPPLGVTARILIALALALLGGIIGAVIGMRMARTKPAAQRRRAEAAAAKVEAATIAKAARKQAVAAPAITEGPTFFDISQLDLDADFRIETGPVVPAEPATARGEPETAIAAETDIRPDPTQKPARAFERPLDPVSFPLPASFPVPGGAAAARLTSATLESLSHLELIERLALSLQKRREEADERSLTAGDPQSETKPASQPLSIPTAAETMPVVPSYYPPAPEPVAARLERLAGPEQAHGDDETPPGADRNGAVALFPDQAPTTPRQNSATTERALRDALAALQRMSGAA